VGTVSTSIQPNLYTDLRCNSVSPASHVVEWHHLVDRFENTLEI